MNIQILTEFYNRLRVHHSSFTCVYVNVSVSVSMLLLIVLSLSLPVFQLVSRPSLPSPFPSLHTRSAQPSPAQARSTRYGLFLVLSELCFLPLLLPSLESRSLSSSQLIPSRRRPSFGP